MENGQYGISGPPAQKFLTQKRLPPKEGQEHAQILHQQMEDPIVLEAQAKLVTRRHVPQVC